MAILRYARLGLVVALCLVTGVACDDSGTGSAGLKRSGVPSSAPPSIGYRTPPPVLIDPTRSATPKASPAPRPDPLLSPNPTTIERSPGAPRGATVYVSNADFEATVRVRIGDFIVVTLRPENGHGWQQPWTTPSGLLSEVRYHRSSDGTLQATYRAERRGGAGILSQYDCGSGSCPAWSVSVNVQS